jgi:hypothetical protein
MPWPRSGYARGRHQLSGRRRGFGGRLAILGVLLVVGALGVTGSGIALRGDPAAWLPDGFVANQQLRDWAHQLGLTSSNTPAPAPGIRPIIFIPGITGSYLTDSSGNEVWPNAGALSDCATGGLFAGPDRACDQKVLQEDALSADGTPAYPVDVANGVDHPAYSGEEARTSSNGTVVAGGVLTGATINHNVLGVVPYGTTIHWYDVALANAARSGYTVAPSDDAGGLAACAGTRRCFVPVGIDWRLSAKVNASRVISIIDAVLQVTGSDRVDIIAHSQGGLIAEAITHDSAATGRIYRIVTEGTRTWERRSSSPSCSTASRA